MALSRCRKIFLFGPLVLLLALVGGLLVKRHLAIRELADYKADLIAQGEKLHHTDLLAGRNINSKDFSELLIEIGQVRADIPKIEVQPSGMAFISHGKADVVTQGRGWVVRRSSGLPKHIWMSWEDFATNSMPEEEDLEHLRQLLQVPDLGAALDYSQGFEIPFDHLHPFRRVAQGFTMDALVHLQAGRTDRVLDRLNLVRLIREVISRDSLLISQLIGMAMTNDEWEVVWEMLQHDLLNDAQWEALGHQWWNTRHVQGFHTAMEMERSLQSSSFEIYRENPGAVSDMLAIWQKRWPFLNPDESGFAQTVMAFPFGDQALDFMSDQGRQVYNHAILVPSWKYIWSYPDEKLSLEIITANIDWLRQAPTGNRRPDRSSSSWLSLHSALDQLTASEEDPIPERYIFTSMGGFFAYSNMIRNLLDAETTRLLVVTAIALKRHAMNHGRHPETLEALVPEFLPRLEADPWSGRPLGYIHQPDTGEPYRLYSAGRNRKDDGGDWNHETTRTSHPRMGRDFVWPWPASMEAVETYHRSKLGEDHGGSKPDPDL